MARQESRGWSVYLDGYNRDIQLEVERSWTGTPNGFRLTLDGKPVISGVPNAFVGVRFSIGKHKCKVRLALVTCSPQQLLIDDRDASEYEVPHPSSEQVRRDVVAGTERVIREREHVVERQVIVVRCKHCGKLTPADFAVCENCGAAKFS